MELMPREYWKSHHRWYNMMEVACITQRRHSGGHGVLTYRSVRRLQLISIWINRSLILSFPSNRIESVSKELGTKETFRWRGGRMSSLLLLCWNHLHWSWLKSRSHDVINVHEIKKGTFELHRNMWFPFQEVHHSQFSAQRTTTRRTSQRESTDRWVRSRGSCLTETIRCYVGH